MNKVIKILDRLVNIITYLIVIFLIVIGAYAIYDVYYVDYTTVVPDEIEKLKPEVENQDDYSFDELRKVNSDIVGWITIDDTVVNYPILYGDDNSMYLRKNYKKEYSVAGSIFLDYRNSGDFSNDYSVIYGHNMSTGSMFAVIKKYESKEYFNTHRLGMLYTVDKAYKMEILAYAVDNAYSDNIYNILKYKNDANSIFSYIKKIAKIKENMEIYNNEKLLLLSTCYASGSNDRKLLLAKLVEINQND